MASTLDDFALLVKTAKNRQKESIPQTQEEIQRHQELKRFIDGAELFLGILCEKYEKDQK